MVVHLCAHSNTVQLDISALDPDLFTIHVDTIHGNIVIIAVFIPSADPIVNSNATNMYSLTIIYVHRRDARTFLATAIIFGPEYLIHFTTSSYTFLAWCRRHTHQNINKT